LVIEYVGQEIGEWDFAAPLTIIGSVGAKSQSRTRIEAVQVARFT
jgi:hypothetical protein